MATKKQIAEIRDELAGDYTALTFAEQAKYVGHDNDLWAVFYEAWGSTSYFAGTRKNEWGCDGEDSYREAVKAHDLMSKAIREIMKSHNDHIFRTWESGNWY